MQKRDAPSKRIQMTILLTVMAATTTIFGCREQSPPPAPAVSAPAPAAPSPARSKEQAMAALMALPELKAWSNRIEKSSAGAAHGALIEYDPKPKLIDGKPYYQLSFVENASDAARHWQSFLVAQSGDAILVEDAASGKTMTLAQWRAERHPLERTSAN
ncbi:MAG: hypothetical protein QFF03_01665 [Pseudomonadota bacterium]|nr:hypothetical protein [Pseudomonadota bacterium]